MEKHPVTTETKSVDGDVSTPCTICGGYGWSFVRQGRDLLRPENEARFKLSRCLHCGHVQQTPLPNELELRAAYSVEYAPYRIGWKESGWPLWKIFREITTRRRMSRLRRYSRGRYLLEVGCGAGDFLYAANRAGWEVKGVEYSDKLAESLRAELGLDVRTGELRPGLWNGDSFDVVALWNVLEHVPSPLDTLVTACSYLRDGGLLFLKIPNLDATEHEKWFGEYWVLLDLPRHLNFFARGSLSTLFGKAGMELAVFETPALDTAWCYFASSWNYILHAESRTQGILRSIEIGARGVLALPGLALQACRGHGTEAFAIAVKRQK